MGLSHLNRIPITNSRDPRVAAYLQVRERDLTGRDGKFIVEGKVTLAALIRQSRFQIESLFLCETRLEPLADLLAELPDGVPIYTAPQTLMDEVAGFPIHRGVLACGIKGQPLDLSDLIPKTGRSTLLALNALSNHDNVGAAFRNAAAFGADGVILDSESCDPLYRKSIRVSAGSALWLPFVHGGTGQAHINALKAAGYTVWAMTPRADATPLTKCEVPDRLAILLGAEGPGLPDAFINACVPVRIPMRDGFDSVNVATAGAIALAHIYAARQGA